MVRPDTMWHKGVFLLVGKIKKKENLTCCEVMPKRTPLPPRHHGKRPSLGAFCMGQTIQPLPTSITSTNSCTAKASSAVASLCGWPRSHRSTSLN